MAPPIFVVLSCNDSYRVGAYCNISSSPCDAVHPCQNEGTCVNDKTLLTGYQCQCSIGFIGSECQEDTRPCKPNTCFNNGIFRSKLTVNGSLRVSAVGMCMNTSNTDFNCTCPDGWSGVHCETRVNYCHDVICQNSGVCLSSFKNYTCRCLGSSYSGRHCETKQNTLVNLQIAAKSFASVAIACLITLLVVFITLDVLKYAFRIGPTPEDLRGAPRRRALRKRAGKRTGQNVPLAVRFIYVH